MTASDLGESAASDAERPAARSGWAARLFADRSISTEWVYGTIVYLALILSISEDDDIDPGQVLFFGFVTMVVFFLAHVYAHTIAAYSRGRQVERPFRAAVRHSVGLLLATVVPSIPLIVAITGAITLDQAVDGVSLLGLLVLAATSLWAFVSRRAPWWACILGTLAAVALGMIVVLLDYIVH
ncbi:hypothetical protein ACFSBZ_09145 [Amnibacterium flavum]|uniref:Uncharacterized protein n=1 Tax=Amnibacterium flavum TaxID=2173173 RepID=A0A2V1HRS5_9MICO|nr:hypothetical protein [Amnibacterium flavum]PVZ95031.1 hypothetical protein DDQ50_00385 [Amnibacterium flavum]